MKIEQQGTGGSVGRRVGQSQIDAGAADSAMACYADGDDGAFADVYAHVAPRLLAFLERRTYNRARAEDLSQSTLLRIHRHRGLFIRGAPVLPWAYAIARRLLIDEERRRICEDRYLEAIDPVHIASSHDVLVARQTARRMEERLTRLPAQHRNAFQLIKLNGMSLAQAAEVLGTTVMAVKLRVHRTKVALRLEIDGDGFD